MPFKSKKQQDYMFMKHPDIAARWAKETPDMKNLPERVQKKSILKKSIRNSIKNLI